MATQQIRSEQILDGTIVNADISPSAGIALAKFAEAVIQADGGQAFTGHQSVGGFNLTNLATPIAAQDAATKAYADSVAAGLDIKASVRAATTANITLSGPQTIDGVAVVAGARVLVKNQTLGATNGIYVVAAGAWTRATDADVSAEVTSGLSTFVEEGTTQGATGWVLITPDPITLGTTVLTFSQFSGGTLYSAGAGLSLTGSVFDVNVATAGSIEIVSDALQVKLDGASLTSTAAGLKVSAYTGDVTSPSGSTVNTLATVNSNVGTFGSATQVAQLTVNGKGLTTAVANVTITPAASSITGGAALTKVDDVNVTLALGGSPTTALLAATSLTLGWAGTLSATRLNANVVQSVVNDTNVTGSIAAQTLTLGWTGTLSPARGGTGIATAFTPGSVVFAGASGVYAQDNAQLFWDDTNNRLGIGTAAPSERLHLVGGNVRVDGRSAFGGTGVSTAHLVVIGANLPDPTVDETAINAFRTVTLTANSIGRSIVAGSLVAGTGANAFGMTGELVGGNFQGQNGLTGTVANLIGSRSITYNTSTGTVTNGVAASAVIQNLNAAGVITNAYGVKAELGFNIGTIANTYGVYVGTMTGGTQTNIPYSFFAADTAARSYFAGNVGIGTSVPTYRLHVFGAGEEARFDGTSNYVSFALSGTAYGYLGYAATIATSGVAGDFAVRSQAGLAFTTGGSTTRVYMDSTGNVGIGTTSPAYKLDVTGSIRTSGQFFAADGTAAAPSYSFTSAAATGWYWRAGSLEASVATAAILQVNSNGVVNGGTNGYAFAGGSVVSVSPDLYLIRDGANILAQRNGTSAQTSRVYTTYTDASNYRRLALSGDPFGGSTPGFIAEGAGTGANPSLYVGIGAGSGSLWWVTTGSARWRVDGNGHILPNLDNTYDIGTASLRVRNIYAAGVSVTGLTTGSVLFAGSSGFIGQDNAKLFWDDSNDRLGIGTASVSAASVTIQTNTGSAHAMRWRNGDATRYRGDLQVNAAGTVMTSFDDTGAVYMPVTINGSAFYFTVSGVAPNGLAVSSAGNVGIGTQSPVSKLSVVGTRGAFIDTDVVASWAGLWFGATSLVPSSTNYNVLSDGTSTLINRPSGGSIAFREANALQVTIATGGNVGIGSAVGAPTAVLHIKAGTTAANTAPLKFTSGALMTTAEAGAQEFLTDDFFGTITTGAARKGFVLDDGTRLTATRLAVASTNGRLINGPANAAGVLTNDGAGVLSWIADAGGSVTGTGTSTRVAFWSSTSGLSSNANLFWDNANSRLGIGTASPSVALHVLGTTGDLVTYVGTNTATYLFNVDSAGRATQSLTGQQGGGSNGGAYFLADGFEESFTEHRARSATSGSRNLRTGSKAGAWLLQLLNDASSSVTSTPVTVGATAPSNSLYVTTAGDVVFGSTTSSSQHVRILDTTNLERGLLIENTSTGNAASAILRLTTGAQTAALLRFGTGHAAHANKLAFIQPGNFPIELWTQDTARMAVSGTGALRLHAYGAGTLVTDASGNVTAATNVVTGTGTTGNLAQWSSAGVLTNGPAASNVPLLNAANIFTEDQEIKNSVPALFLTNTASSNKQWYPCVIGSSFVIFEAGVSAMMTIAAGGGTSLVGGLNLTGGGDTAVLSTYGGIYADPPAAGAAIQLTAAVAGAQGGVFAHPNTNVYLGSWTNSTVVFRQANNDRWGINSGGDFLLGSSRIALGVGTPSFSSGGGNSTIVGTSYGFKITKGSTGTFPMVVNYNRTFAAAPIAVATAISSSGATAPNRVSAVATTTQVTIDAVDAALGTGTEVNVITVGY